MIWNVLNGLLISDATMVIYLDAGEQLRQYLPARGLPDCLDNLWDIFFLQRFEDGGIVLIELLALPLLAALQTEFLNLIRDAESWTMRVSGAVKDGQMKHTIDIQVVHGSKVGLGLASNKPHAIRFATEALLCFVPVGRFL